MSYVEFLVVKVLGNLIVPPGGVIVLGVLGLMLLPFARRLAGFLLLVMVVSLYALSTGTVAGILERGLYEHPALAPDAEVPAAGAIVVLGAGSYRDPPEYDGTDTVGRFTLERLRYAAWLHRRTGLPLLVTGGKTFPGTPAEAGAMALSLKDDFGIGVRFVEDRSRNTADNAVNSARMLADAGDRPDSPGDPRDPHDARGGRVRAPGPRGGRGADRDLGRPRAGRRRLAAYGARFRPLLGRGARVHRPRLVPAAFLAPRAAASGCRGLRLAAGTSGPKILLFKRRNM